MRHHGDGHAELALRRARAELHAPPNTIDALAEFEAAGVLADDEVVDLAILRRLQDARRVRLAPWRGPWRREAREEALVRTSPARGPRGRRDRVGQPTDGGAPVTPPETSEREPTMTYGTEYENPETPDPFDGYGGLGEEDAASRARRLLAPPRLARAVGR